MQLGVLSCPCWPLGLESSVSPAARGEPPSLGLGALPRSKPAGPSFSASGHREWSWGGPGTAGVFPACGCCWLPALVGLHMFVNGNVEEAEV